MVEVSRRLEIPADLERLADVREAVRDDVAAFRRSMDNVDDITIVAVGRHPNA